MAKGELSRFYKTLGYLEGHTWGMLRGVPREKGLSIDKNNDAYKLLQLRMPESSTFGHFRVDGADPNMRFFVGLRSDLAYILLIDREGSVQH